MKRKIDSIRTSSEGQKDWKGLINLADETGTKQYIFNLVTEWPLNLLLFHLFG